MPASAREVSSSDVAQSPDCPNPAADAVRRPSTEHISHPGDSTDVEMANATPSEERKTKRKDVLTAMQRLVKRRRRCRRKKAKINENNHLSEKPNATANGTATTASVSLNAMAAFGTEKVILDKAEFQRLNNLYGPVTIDAAADEYSAVCPVYCGSEKPYTSLDVTNNMSFINLLNADDPVALLKHFETHRGQSPHDTKALILAPQVADSAASIELKKLLSTYLCVHTYPSGTYLFHSATSATMSEYSAPTQWPMCVYLADDSAENRLAHALEHADVTEQLKAMLAAKEGVSYTPKTKVKPHQPSFLSEKLMVTSSSDTDLLVLNPYVDALGQSVPTLLDSGASTQFISSDFVRAHNLPVHPLENKLRVVMADGRMVLASQYCELKFAFGDFSPTIRFVVTPLQSSFRCVLGMSFLREHNPNIDWKLGTLNFGNNPSSRIQGTVTPRTVQDFATVSANSMARLIKKQDNDTVFFCAIVRDYNATATVTADSIDAEIAAVTTDYGPSFDSSVQQLLNKHRSIATPLDSLPRHRPGLDHEIPLTDAAELPPTRIYRLTPAELTELREQLNSYLQKGFIRESFSPYAAPVLFAKKANGGLRMCIDYRGLNKYTKKVNFPIPHADMLLDMLSGAKVYSALDLALGYHQLRIKPDDVHKTAFATQFGQFEFLVMPFGLTSAPSSFQRLMTSILKPYNNTFVLVYLDDILIFSNSLDEHITHLDFVLSKLEENDIRLRLSKCFFGKSELEYLGHTVSGAGMRPSPSKLKAVKDWPRPKSVTETQSFLGFANFYRRYVRKYSDLAHPMHAICHKNTKFEWTDTQEQAFLQLKNALCSAPVLTSPRTGADSEFVVATDASKLALGAVLLQADEKGELHPCAYYAKTLQPHQTRYPVYDQELLGVVCALQEWRCYLAGSKKITVITDHATLRHLPDQSTVSRRHATWHEILSEFIGVNSDGEQVLEILYRKGKDNEADALSRRTDLHYALSAYEDTVLENELSDVQEFLSALTTVSINENILQKIRTSYALDPAFRKGNLAPGVALDDQDGLYYFSDKVCVPNDNNLINMIISEFHDSAGHPSEERTYLAVVRHFWFPRMRRKIKLYCKHCATCARTKASTTKPLGTLNPLPKGSKPWEVISMDFITGLPEVDGYDAIATFVDCFTKQAHFVPISVHITASQLARVYLDSVYRLHGLSRIIISDRDPKFTSSFWKSLFTQLKTRLNISSAYHPQTDGQTERTHRTIEQIVRSFIHTHHDQWLSHLSLAEFSYNNSVHSATKYSPFESLYGFSPLTPPALFNTSINPCSATDLIQKIHDIHDLISEELKLADAYQKGIADRKLTKFEFSVGDHVWLSTANLLIRNQPTKKFRQRFIGPYKIISKISAQAYKLRLPPSFACHNVFHIGKLRPCTTPGVAPDNTPSEIDLPADEFIVDSITDCRLDTQSPYFARGPSLSFLVHWYGYDHSHDTWQHYSRLKQVDVLKEFLLHSDKLKSIARSAEYVKLQKQYPARLPRLTFD